MCLDFMLLYEEFVVLLIIGVGDVVEGDVVLNVGNCEGWVDMVDI